MTRHIKKVGTGKKEVSPEQVEEFVFRVKTAWQDAVSSIIETGKILLEYKDRIPHGQWEALFTNGKLIKAPIPFSSNTAGRLMRIAENPILSNPAHAQDLPPSWATLYELSGIPDQELERALKKGQIHPDMQRKDVPRLHYFNVRNAPKYISHLLGMSLLVEPEELAQQLFECGDPTYLSIIRGGRYEGALVPVRACELLRRYGYQGSGSVQGHRSNL